MAGRRNGSAELSWEVMHWVSVQTNWALNWCKLIWGSLNMKWPESDYFGPWPCCPLLLVQSFEQIAELLLPTANTEKQLLSFTVHMLRNLTTSSTGEAMRIGYLSGVLMRGKCSAPSDFFFFWINLKKQSFPIVVCFSLRGVIKTDCSGWFTRTQVKTIKN